VHDPEHHHDHAPAGASEADSAGDTGAVQRIGEKIEEVAAWYAEQIHAERRRPAPDAGRVEELLAERAACTKALRDLPTATGEELERIEALYDAKRSGLTGA
jgi:hypothetical protein